MSPKFQLFSLLLFHILFTSTYTEIIFVFEQFRHGARGSIFVLHPTDYVDNYQIPWYGNGELSGIGMRQHYLIGVRSREKYKDMLSKTFDPREIYVVSTDQNRTILSAQAQLLGMFPPQSGIELTEEEIKMALPPNNITQEMKDEIKRLSSNALPEKIQLIPIHLFNQEDKKYYTLTEASECPTMKHIKEVYEHKKIVTDFIEEFNRTYGIHLMKLLKKNNTDFLFSYFNMLGITDHFIANYAHRKNLTKIEQSGIPLKEFLQKCKDFKKISLFEVESDPDIGVMAMSPTMMKLLKWMDNRIHIDITGQKIKDEKNPKYVMYSGHDFTIVPTEQFLNKAFGTTTHYPEFAANQFFELHRMDNIPKKELNASHYYVEYYYNDVLELNVTYTEFKRRVSEIAWSMDRINSFCQIQQEDLYTYCLYFILILSLLIIVIKIRRQSFHQQKKVSQELDDYSTSTYENDESLIVKNK